MKNNIYHNKKIYFTTALVVNTFLAKVAYAQWNVNDLTEFGLPDASIYTIIENILNWLLAILGIVAVIGFVISGLMYLTAAGNEDRAESAKKAMTYSIIGIIVGISGLVIIQAVDWALSGLFF